MSFYLISNNLFGAPNLRGKVLWFPTAPQKFPNWQFYPTPTVTGSPKPTPGQAIERRKSSFCPKLTTLLLEGVSLFRNKFTEKKNPKKKKKRKEQKLFRILVLNESNQLVSDRVMGESSDSVSIDIDMIPLGGKVSKWSKFQKCTNKASIFHLNALHICFFYEFLALFLCFL